MNEAPCIETDHETQTRWIGPIRRMETRGASWLKFINKACGSVFLIIGKPQAPPAQLLLEDAILLDEVRDAFGQ